MNCSANSRTGAGKPDRHGKSQRSDSERDSGTHIAPMVIVRADKNISYETISRDGHGTFPDLNVYLAADPPANTMPEPIFVPDGAEYDDASSGVHYWLDQHGCACSCSLCAFPAASAFLHAKHPNGSKSSGVSWHTTACRGQPAVRL